MSSLLRRQSRRIKRKFGNHEPKARPFIYHADGGYSVLRPTKGWLRVSPARLRAQHRLFLMVQGIDRRMGRI